jgi:hypothetical protein
MTPEARARPYREHQAATDLDPPAGWQGNAILYILVGAIFTGALFLPGHGYPVVGTLVFVIGCLVWIIALLRRIRFDLYAVLVALRSAEQPPDPPDPRGDQAGEGDQLEQPPP